MSDFNKAINWRLKVREQKKTEKSIQLNCVMMGKKKDDGSMNLPMDIRVMITTQDEYDTKCEWPHKDLTGQYILVSGRFNIDEWERQKDTVLTFCIFADKIEEYVYDKENPVPVNKIENWGLRVYDLKDSKNGKKYMKTTKSGGKKEDGTYKKSMFIDIWPEKECNEFSAAWLKKTVDVDGSFQIGEWNGNLTFTVYATGVKEHVWENGG